MQAPCMQAHRSEMNAIRVLIVDDNKDAATSLSRLLSALGKETRVTYDGLSAVAAAAEFRPDVAFLDLGMPGMDGIETARRLREQPEGKACILIALTGWGDKEDRARTLNAGFATHLVKPVKVNELEATLKSLLANRPPN